MSAEALAGVTLDPVPLDRRPDLPFGDGEPESSLLQGIEPRQDERIRTTHLAGLGEDALKLGRSSKTLLPAEATLGHRVERSLRRSGEPAPWRAGA